MTTARKIVITLIRSGAIPPECEDVAVAELHQELVRRSRRVCSTLAAAVSCRQLASRISGISAKKVVA